MRIAMIGQKGVPATQGGIERHVEALAMRFAAQGHTVTAYTRPYFTPSRLRSHRGIRLVSLPSIHTKHFDAISHTLFATLHALIHRYDVFHFHGVGPSLLSFLPRLVRPKALVVVTIHSLDRKHSKWGPIARWFLRLGERTALVFPHITITVSKTLQRYCRVTYGKDTVCIPNGVEMPTKRVPTTTILRRFNLTPGQYILSVSRLIPLKGLHHLIRAFRTLRTSTHLVITGEGFFSDAYVRQLHELADGDPRILFTGMQNGKALEDLYANAGLFVLASETEGLPLALLEAASHGVCVLASDIPENMEVLASREGQLGYTFSTGNVVDLRQKLLALLRQPAINARIGQRARRFVSEHYRWDTAAQTTEQTYRIAMKRHGLAVVPETLAPSVAPASQ